MLSTVRWATVVGALRVADVAGRRFSDAEVLLAQAFADRAALSLEPQTMATGL